MIIKKLEEDILWDVQKPIYRKWWQFWKPKIIGSYTAEEVIFKKGYEYIDAEGKSISELYNEMREYLNKSNTEKE